MSQDFLVGKIDVAKKAYFLGDTNSPKNEAAEAPAADSDKKLSKSAKIMIGATALATAVVAGIAIVRNIQKGKAAEAARKAQEAARKAEQEAKELAERLEREAVEKEEKYFNKTYNSINKSAEESADIFVEHGVTKEEERINKKYVENLKQTLHSKTPINSETIDARLKPEVKEGAWSKEDMKEYYESDCVNVEKLKSYTSYKNFSADGKIVKEKRIYTASSKYGEGATETIRINKNGTHISEIKTPDGELVQSRIYKPYGHFDVTKYFENGKLSKIVSKDKTGETETIFGDGIKTSMRANNDGTIVFKIYEQDKNGKYRCINRFKKDEESDFYTKSVEYINDGKYSKTTTEIGTTKTIIRDKKGNIIDESKIKTPKLVKPKPSKGTDGAKGADGAQDAGILLASWYKDYLKLCKEFGESVRECGVKGGAGDHYFELRLRKSDPVAYENYLRIQRKRARYNEKDNLLLTLREEDHLEPIDVSDICRPKIYYTPLRTKKKEVTVYR